MKGRYLWLILISILIPAVAWAAGLFSRDIPSTVTITEPPALVANLQVYSDRQCTIEVAALDWSSIQKGQSSLQRVYVKNTGEIDYTAVNVVSDLPASTGGVSSSPSGFALSVGVDQQVDVTLLIDIAAPSGIANFTTSFQGAY